MLARLVLRSALTGIQPHVWPTTAGSPVPRHAPKPGSVTAETSALAVLSKEQSLLLQMRMAELESTAERRAKETRDATYREGEAAGRIQGSAELRPVLEELIRTIHDLAGLRAKLRDQAEADVVRLALAIARRIVHRELNTDPESITGLVKVALNKLRVQETARVRVHPAHLAIIKEMLSRSTGTAHIEVSGDSEAVLGGVVFETSRGEFDVSVDVQFKEIDKGLADRLGN